MDTVITPKDAADLARADELIIEGGKVIREGRSLRARVMARIRQRRYLQRKEEQSDGRA